MDVYMVPVYHSPYGGADTVADGYTTYRLCDSKFMKVRTEGDCIIFIMRNKVTSVEQNLVDHMRFKSVFCYTDVPDTTTSAPRIPSTKAPQKPASTPTPKTQTPAGGRSAQEIIQQWDLL
ncbi:unnamed protein product [Dibothriocephalus latus]|uniref:Uncharacterized protein n=1 Tax=Dibothriocephalus latus TaxID=60516 RepID=A0A3P6U347_DIBLA|nr:unnamed protein product [Dibothriocephalus latus]